MRYRNAFLWYGARVSAFALIAGVAALGCARGGESRHDTRAGMGMSGSAGVTTQGSQAGASGDYGRSGSTGVGVGAQAYGGGTSREYGGSAQSYGEERGSARGTSSTRTATATSERGTTARSASDRQLTKRVKQALNKDTQIKSMDLDVEASRGTITLSGRVDQDSQRRKAEQLAKRVKGVKRVKNRIEVGSAGSTQEQR